MIGPVCLLVPSLERLERLAGRDFRELARTLNALGYRLRSRSLSSGSRGKRPIVPYKGTDAAHVVFALRRNNGRSENVYHVFGK